MGDALMKPEPTAMLAQAQMLDVALRTAGALKNARGLLPESLRNEGEIVAVLLAGQELGLMPMAALRGLQVVRGKVIISYDTMIALLRRAGYRISWLESSATKATLRLTDPHGEQHTETWDEARAKRAGLWGKGTWSQYPDVMLKARCVSSAARAFAGEVLAGVYVEGELEQPAATVVSLAATGSPEVRDLGAALHEPDREDPEGADPLAAEMHALAQCKTAGDVETWVRAVAKKITSEPDCPRKRDRWKAIQRKAAGVTPPIRVEPLRALFTAALKPKAADVVDGERDPADELGSVETADGLRAWFADHRDWLAGITQGSEEEAVVWNYIRATAERCGDVHLSDELSELLG